MDHDNPGMHPFVDAVPLEPRDRGEQMQLQASGRRIGVDALVQAHEGDSERRQLLEQGHEVMQVASEASTERANARLDAGSNGGPGSCMNDLCRASFATVVAGCVPSAGRDDPICSGLPGSSINLSLPVGGRRATKEERCLAACRLARILTLTVSTNEQRIVLDRR